MLLGEHYHSLDQKNRIAIPAKLREDLGNPFMISKGLDGCLYAQSMETWNAFIAKLNALPNGLENARIYKRFFLAGATQVEMDKQGRILIPQSLVQYSNLIDEVVVVGMDDKLEIWSHERWDEINNTEVNMNEIAQDMSRFGL